MIDPWLLSVAPTAKAIVRQFHEGSAQLCPGLGDSRCCRFDLAFIEDEAAASGHPCTQVNWAEDDPEYHILRTMSLIRQIDRHIKIKDINSAISEAIILGKILRDYEILFYHPEDIHKIDNQIERKEIGNRRWLYGPDLERVTAVDRFILKGFSVSAAWNEAADELECSRSTIRRAWAKL